MELILQLLIGMLLTIGFIVSCYAAYILMRKKQDMLYTPLCDISSRISCTTVLQSPHGKMFGFSNAYLGIIFNLFAGVLLISGYYTFLLVLISGAVVVSVYLAAIMFRMRVWCVVCIITYLLHLVLFLAIALLVLF